MPFSLSMLACMLCLCSLRIHSRAKFVSCKLPQQKSDMSVCSAAAVTTCCCVGRLL